jgi:hypothetical protein
MCAAYSLSLQIKINCSPWWPLQVTDWIFSMRPCFEVLMFICFSLRWADQFSVSWYPLQSALAGRSKTKVPSRRIGKARHRTPSVEDCQSWLWHGQKMLCHDFATLVLAPQICWISSAMDNNVVTGLKPPREQCWWAQGAMRDRQIWRQQQIDNTMHWN